MYTLAWQLFLVLLFGSHRDHEPSISVPCQFLYDLDAEAPERYAGAVSPSKTVSAVLRRFLIFTPRGDLNQGPQLWSGQALIASWPESSCRDHKQRRTEAANQPQCYHLSKTIWRLIACWRRYPRLSRMKGKTRTSAFVMISSTLSRTAITPLAPNTPHPHPPTRARSRSIQIDPSTVALNLNNPMTTCFRSI